MIFFFSGLQGTLDSADQLPEIDPAEFEQQLCDDFVNDTTVARVTGYVSDIFTTENHLNVSVGLIGPTTTNIAVTPMIVFYGGGVYYNEAECTNYVEEEVPIQCQEERAGILSFTCLTKVTKIIYPHDSLKAFIIQNGVNCAELMPRRCGIFFNPPPEE